jgi:hypothetical protein
MLNEGGLRFQILPPSCVTVIQDESGVGGASE